MQNLYSPDSLLHYAGNQIQLVHLCLLWVPIHVSEKPQSFPLPQ